MIKNLLSIFNESSRSFEDQEKDEEVILLLRRHPFIALMPASGMGTLALVPILIFLIFYSYIVDSGYMSLFLFVMSLLYLWIWVMTFYYLTMYTLNTVIVTNKRIIDRDQHGFFDQKVSELHLYRVQDITVSVKGIIPTMLHYGDIIVQTAGIEQKFVFHEMPHPEEVKSAIMKVVSMANSGVRPFTDHQSSSV